MQFILKVDNKFCLKLLDQIKCKDSLENMIACPFKNQVTPMNIDSLPKLYPYSTFKLKPLIPKHGKVTKDLNNAAV